MNMAAAGFGGQTLNDRLNAARYALAGQGLAQKVCKATTEELLGPKKKHLDYLLQCTHEPNVSIPNLANLLIERTQQGSWVIVFKSLITVHHLMCYGNERFTQYLATSHTTFNLSDFLDRVTPGGTEMSIFIRRYSKYILSKINSYRSVGFDFSKVKRTSVATVSTGHTSGGDQMKGMTVKQLLQTIPILQSQIDSLLEFDPIPGRDLNNPVIKAAFMLLFRDLIRLFATYNDAIISILQAFFGLTKHKEARASFELYLQFTDRLDSVADFLEIATSIGVDKGEIPNLAQAPQSLIEKMEALVYTLEGKDPATIPKREPKPPRQPRAILPPAPPLGQQVRQPFPGQAVPPNPFGQPPPFGQRPPGAIVQAPPPVPAGPVNPGQYQQYYPQTQQPPNPYGAPPPVPAAPASNPFGPPAAAGHRPPGIPPQPAGYGAPGYGQTAPAYVPVPPSTTAYGQQPPPVPAQPAYGAYPQAAPHKPPPPAAAAVPTSPPSANPFNPFAAEEAPVSSTNPYATSYTAPPIVPPAPTVPQAPAVIPPTEPAAESGNPFNPFAMAIDPDDASGGNITAPPSSPYEPAGEDLK